MAWTYILECKDNSFYVGSGHDLVERVRQHQLGIASKYTKRRRPVRLVWAQEFERVDEAFVVEHQLKGWSRAKKIALIEGRFGDLPALAWRGATVETELSPEVRDRVQREAGAAEQAGGFVAPSPQGFVTRPLDALATKGQRQWTPRAVTRARKYGKGGS
ncbi:hypothetical protein GCM10025789_16210 [Tessaracoccus lubricantis]|uniref:GIY-YIG domain-containing protein n=1 Tax=Tessaracoccus lubricantis TaxID=545543 RepID=A0ABP9FDU6_9ACTN